MNEQREKIDGIAVSSSYGGETARGQEFLPGDEHFKPLAERMLLDTRIDEMLTPVNFDPNTGEDCRGRPYESIYRRLVVIADARMSEALNSEDFDFNPFTGERIPPRVVEMTSPDGRISRVVSPQNCEARVSVWRAMIEKLVEKARSQGIRVPRYDAKTGKPIPEDSLMAYDAISEQQRWGARGQSLDEVQQDLADLEVADRAVDLLAKMKALKQEKKSE